MFKYFRNLIRESLKDNWNSKKTDKMLSYTELQRLKQKRKLKRGLK